MGLFRNKGKLPDMSVKLKGCRQIVNGVDLGEEYKKLYAEYSRLFDIVSKQSTASNNEFKPIRPSVKV